jgi:hypothetical protein
MNPLALYEFEFFAWRLGRVPAKIPENLTAFGPQIMPAVVVNLPVLNSTNANFFSALMYTLTTASSASREGEGETGPTKLVKRGTPGDAEKLKARRR